jgi:hypothetical protein
MKRKLEERSAFLAGALRWKQKLTALEKIQIKTKKELC